MIRAKWLGQECTVVAMTTYAGEAVFLISALPGQAFSDGCTMLTAYRPELHDIEQVGNAAQAEALENWQAAITDTNNMVDNDNRAAVAAALSIEAMAKAAYVSTL